MKLDTDLALIEELLDIDVGDLVLELIDVMTSDE